MPDALSDLAERVSFNQGAPVAETLLSDAEYLAWGDPRPRPPGGLETLEHAERSVPNKLAVDLQAQRVQAGARNGNPRERDRNVHWLRPARGKAPHSVHTYRRFSLTYLPAILIRN